MSNFVKNCELYSSAKLHDRITKSHEEKTTISYLLICKFSGSFATNFLLEL